MITKTKGLLAALVLSGLLAAAPAAAADRITREAAAAEVAGIPVFQVLAKHYPKLHDQLLDDLVRGLNAGRPYSALTGEINAAIVKLVLEQTPKANVENTIAMLGITRDQAAALLAKDPAYCLSILGARPYDINATRALPEELTDRERALMAKLLEQTAIAPETPSAPHRDKAAKAAKAVAMDAYDRLSDDRLRVALGEIAGDPTKAETPLQQTAFCEFSIAMFDQLLKMPPIEGAQTFRALSEMN